jgi:FPC/CPF motif-containing protein YcgG
MQLHDKNSLLQLDAKSWESKAFSDFKSILQSNERSFPCTLGVAGFSANQLRFYFNNNEPDSTEAAEQLAAALQCFIPSARYFGKNTSLVVFFSEQRDLGINEYETIFWKLLNKLNMFDVGSWPSDIPRQTDHKDWEFSFAGEPIFVVCNTPSHKARKSRYASNFMITFQLRWVFEGVVGKDAPNSEKIKMEIRRRLSAFDFVPASPNLGVYGDEDNREWQQYFLKDDNQPVTKGCPFDLSANTQTPQRINTKLKDLEQVVSSLLPPTGSVEVQIDTPFRSHTLHKHSADESLHIVKGSIAFSINNETIVCGPGDRFLLPSETPHSAIAGAEGCTYVIANRLVFWTDVQPRAMENIHD